MSVTPETPTKIAVMIGQLARDGSERQMYSFLAHCDRERWSPLVHVSGALGSWKDPIRELGIPVTLLHGKPVMKMWQFRQSCKTEGVQRFFSWSAYTNGYGLALLGLDIPRIGSIRSIYPGDSSDRPKWPRSWMSLAGVSTIVCNSKESAVAICRRAGNRKRVFHVPNSVKPIEDITSCRQTWRQRLEIADSEVLILGVGRLVARKNFARFIDTVALVNKTVALRAVVAGREEGSLESLLRHIDASGLKPGLVRLIGAVPDARELMCAADVFVLSSDYEGMPNVVMEAMAAGVPCVCTRVNGVAALIEHGVSGFITDFEADSLAEKVLLLVRDKKLREEMGTRAAEHMKSCFDPTTIAAHLWQLCE